jgi:phage terminase large subunit GpA-like protein
MDFVNAPAAEQKELIIRKSAQLGFTLAYLIIICYLAATRPTHVLFAMDSAKEAKNISARLQRLLTTNTALAGVFTDEGEDDLQNLLLRLRGMLVHLGGSGAPGFYANKSIGLAILDELDRHMAAAGGKHANTIDLARDRLKKVEEGKIIGGGTPASFEGETNQNYLTGTREELHGECPHCHHLQPIRWERIRFEHCKALDGKWDYARVLNETYLQCENELCTEPIREHHKAYMLHPDRVKWVEHNDGKDDWPRALGRCSLWINDLYSRDVQTSWGRIAVKWLDAQKSPSKLLNFFNETLGCPQKDQKTEITKSDLHKLNGGYQHGCMPKMPAFNPATGAAAILMGVDNQGSGERKWVKLGLTPEGEAFTIDYGRCMSFQELIVEADKPVWIGFEAPPEKELEAIREKCLAEERDYFAALRERYPERKFFTVTVGFIDEGHDTFVVRDFCHSTADPARGLPPRFFPCKGIGKVHAVALVEEIRNKFRIAKDDPTAPFVTVYHFSDDDLKRDLYIGRIGGFDAIKSGKSATPRLWFPAYTEDEFFEELAQEKRGQIKHKGKLVWMWLPPKGPNDWGDAVKMVFACWHIVKAEFPLAA